MANKNAKKKVTKKKTTPTKKKTSTKVNTTKTKTTKTNTTKKTNTPKKTSTTKKKTVVSNKKNVNTTKKTREVKKLENIKITPLKEKIKKEQKEIVPKKKKKSFNINYIFVFFFLIMIIVCLYTCFYVAPTPIVNNIYIDENNNMIIKYEISKYRYRNKIYCLFKSDDSNVSENDEGWVLSSKNTCSYPILDKTYYAYLKNEDGLIYSVSSSNTLGRIYNLKTDKDKIYLAKNDTYKINITYDFVGHVDDIIKYSIENDKILSIEDGIITPKKDGTTKVCISVMNESTCIDIIVSSLITKRPKIFDEDKPYLGCDKYTKEENDLLDEILKDRINAAGYKTRAGVVEAARFLTLEFPYRINYFYENGRQTTNNVDGEGRYYHKGLYLDSSRYKSITGSRKGPKEWGCMLYSNPDKKKSPNGLDCSGFVSWVLLNGGFDVKDVGAGWSDRLDLTDYGQVKKVTTSLVDSNKIKVGDLLHSTRLGGHIGIIVGMDKNNYYIAQAIWYKPIGVVITKINKHKLSTLFPHVVLMDKYYKKDGNLTNMW